MKKRKSEGKTRNYYFLTIKAGNRTPSSFPTHSFLAARGGPLPPADDPLLRHHDLPGHGGQPPRHLRRGQEPRDEDGEERLRRQPGHLRPHAMPDHHAAHAHRDPLPHLAVREQRGRFYVLPLVLQSSKFWHGSVFPV